MSKVIKLHKKDFPVNLIEAIYGVKFEPKQRAEYPKRVNSQFLHLKNFVQNGDDDLYP